MLLPGGPRQMGRGSYQAGGGPCWCTVSAGAGHCAIVAGGYRVKAGGVGSPKSQHVDVRMMDSSAACVVAGSVAIAGGGSYHGVIAVVGHHIDAGVAGSPKRQHGDGKAMDSSATGCLGSARMDLGSIPGATVAASAEADTARVRGEVGALPATWRQHLCMRRPRLAMRKNSTGWAVANVVWTSAAARSDSTKMSAAISACATSAA